MADAYFKTLYPSGDWFPPEEGGNHWWLWSRDRDEVRLYVLGYLESGSGVFEFILEHGLAREQLDNLLVDIGGCAYRPQEVPLPPAFGGRRFFRCLFDIPSLAGRDLIEVRLRIRPRLRPCDLDPASPDTRVMGLAMGNAWFRSSYHPLGPAETYLDRRKVTYLDTGEVPSAAAWTDAAHNHVKLTTLKNAHAGGRCRGHLGAMARQGAAPVGFGVRPGGAEDAKDPGTDGGGPAVRLQLNHKAGIVQQGTKPAPAVQRLPGQRAQAAQVGQDRPFQPRVQQSHGKKQTAPFGKGRQNGFLHLRAHPFRRNMRGQPRARLYRGSSGRFDVKSQLGGKPNRPQHAQGVLAEAVPGSAHTPDFFLPEISLPAERVDDAPASVKRHCVDGEITARKVFLKLRVECNAVRVPLIGIPPLAAEGGDLHLPSVQQHGDGAVPDAGRYGMRKEPHNLFRARRRGDIPVLRLPAQQVVAHAAAHGMGGVSMPAQVRAALLGKIRKRGHILFPPVGMF